MGWRHKAPPANQQDCRGSQMQGQRIKPLRMGEEECERPSSAHPPPDTDQVIQVDRELTVANRKLTAPTGNHARNEGNSWSQNTRRWPGR